MGRSADANVAVRKDDPVVRVPLAADPDTVLQAVDELEADVVAVASHPDLSGHALRRLAWSLDERCVDLIVSPGIVEVAGPRLPFAPSRVYRSSI